MEDLTCEWYLTAFLSYQYIALLLSLHNASGCFFLKFNSLAAASLSTEAPVIKLCSWVTPVELENGFLLSLTKSAAFKTCLLNFSKIT